MPEGTAPECDLAAGVGRGKQGLGGMSRHLCQRRSPADGERKGGGDNLRVQNVSWITKFARLLSRDNNATLT